MILDAVSGYVGVPSRRRAGHATSAPFRVRALGPRDHSAALALCLVDPVSAVLAAGRVEDLVGRATLGGELWGSFDGDGLVALGWFGANFVPVSPSGEGVTALAREALLRGRRFSSVVGERSVVLAAWQVLTQAWGTPRELRADQPSLVMREEPRVPGDPELRPARTSDLDVLLPACVAMFSEEYGYSPLAGGGSYAARVRQLVESGRSFVSIDRAPGGERRVAFKAEIGAFALGVAQIQGVWVDPALRSRGRGAAGVAALVEQARELGASTVSLYVNDYNTPARRAYAHAGFEQVGSYATVVC